MPYFSFGQSKFLVELRNEGGSSDDRPCHQLRKKGNIETEVEGIPDRFNISTVHINGIGQNLESKKGNPYRQHYVARIQGGSSNGRNKQGKKVGILEIDKNAQARCNGHQKKKFFLLLIGALPDGDPDEVINNHRNYHHQE